MDGWLSIITLAMYGGPPGFERASVHYVRLMWEERDQVREM